MEISSKLLLWLFIPLLICAKSVHDLELKDSRVAIPWSEFREVLEKRTTPVLEAMEDSLYPPVNYLLSSAHITGKVINNRVARFRLKGKIIVPASRELKTNGWIVVPLGDDYSYSKEKAVIEAVSLNGKSVPLQSHNNKNSLLINKAGSYNLTVEYYAPIINHEGNWRFALLFPEIASAELTLMLPNSRAEVWLNGTEVLTKYSDKTTSFTKAVSLGGELSFRYSLVGDDMVGGSMSSKLFATNATLMKVKENRVNYHVQIDYQLWHQKLQLFKVLIPKKVPLESVYGEGVVKWNILSGQKVDTLLVETSFAPKQHYRLSLEFSQKLESVESDITVPQISVVDADRESGYLAVVAPKTISVMAKENNLTAVTSQELPSFLQGNDNILLSFKYNKPPYRCNLEIKRYKDMPVLEILADEVYFEGLVTEEGGQLMKYRYFIRNNHRQYLNLKLPKKWELWSLFIDGNPVMPAKGESREHVLIPLKKMAKAEVGKGFTLELVYWHKAEPLKEQGEFLLIHPLADIDCQKIEGKLWLPNNFTYDEFTGSFTMASYLPETILQKKAALSQQMNNLLPQGSIASINSKGVSLSLPVEVSVPKEGRVFHFTKKLTPSG